jgi:predicted small metal-binding protein
LEWGGLTPLSNKSKHQEERNMGQRKSIDCRNYPSENNCSLKISGTEEEVLDAAVQHAASVHGHEKTPELREQIKSMLKDEND